MKHENMTTTTRSHQIYTGLQRCITDYVLGTSVSKHLRKSLQQNLRLRYESFILQIYAETVRTTRKERIFYIGDDDLSWLLQTRIESVIV
jgi:hypothetical protein